MTDEQGFDPESERQQPHSEVSSEMDELVRSTLASLDSPPMPDWVEERLMGAIAAASAQRSEQTAPTPAPVLAPVTDLQARRTKRGSRWFLAVAGVAAAGVIGLVVGRDLIAGSTPPAPQAQAAAVPMSASTMHYSKQTLVSQAAKQLPTWQSAATAATSTSTPSSASSATPATSEAPTASPSTSVLRSLSPEAEPTPIPMNMRMTINTCLPSVTDRAPLHVEVAVYRDPKGQTDEPVAVVAVPAENQAFDVYVMGLHCTASDPQLRAHIRVQDAK